jgi:hypothetical protein
MMTTNFHVGIQLGTLVGSHQDSDTRPRLLLTSPCLLGHETEEDIIATGICLSQEKRKIPDIKCRGRISFSVFGKRC